MLEAASTVAGRWRQSEAWSTATVPRHKQFEKWREFVNDAHMRWEIRPLRCDSFPAFVRQGRHDGFRLTHLTARQPGIVGVRGSHEIGLDSEAFYNLLYVMDGSIELQSRSERTVLTSGTFALWDTTRPMRFETGKGLRQVTFVVPQGKLQRALPRVRDYVGRPIAARSGAAQLFARHLAALDDVFGELPLASASQVLSATVDLLSATISSALPAPTNQTSTEALRMRVKSFIEQNLADPDLDAQAIAQACGASERHLRRAFCGDDQSPVAWLRRRRLEKARQDLISHPGLPVTEVAFRWGFADTSTFSKSFRQQFGVSPKEARAGGPSS